MDGESFDRVTRWFVVGKPRREATRALVGGAVGAAIALWEPTRGRAAPSGCKRFCGFYGDRKPGKCQRDCARCEVRGGEMCGIGFLDPYVCCPPGEVCLRQWGCCPTEQLCNTPGGPDCCASGARCVDIGDGLQNCEPAPA